MKKILVLLTAIFLLIGCTQTNNNVSVDEPVTDESTYQNEELNISFNYPSDWTIKHSSDKSVVVQSTISSNGSEMYISFPAESFDEYEESIKGEEISIQNTSSLEDIGYPSKEYRQRGGLHYLIEIKGHYVSIRSEVLLTQDLKEGLKKILNSLSF